MARSLLNRLQQIDVVLTTWLAHHGIAMMRISLGIVFVWFGLQKFFPGLSPLEELVKMTMAKATFGLVSPDLAVRLLAALETLVGIGLLLGKFMRLTLVMLLFVMIGTALSVVFFPERVFTHIPYALSLEGQHIVKNLVLGSAGLVIGATVRGGKVVADPDVAQAAHEADQQEAAKAVS